MARYTQWWEICCQSTTLVDSNEWSVFEYHDQFKESKTLIVEVMGSDTKGGTGATWEPPSNLLSKCPII
jgi:hypothetical protein